MSGDYRARTSVPELACRAEALATELGFTLSCRPEVGRLLHTLAATVRDGRLADPGLGRSSSVIVETHVDSYA